ncbi:gustatory and pheromone receptor 32a-like [Diachasma alloeum]|uniref:Gustatory receptor n=1 Tax=Diachasma alloeum TaxID=454923 RepID=A0A4E0RZ20_9HYME|nr:gustatory and pheromone receptor 32a-like [Diachasma alloeum]THK33111.1 gustatory receptor 35 [Diachasma alloeum]
MSSASFKINLLTFRVTQKVLLLMGLAPYTVTIEAPPAKESASPIKFSFSKRGCVYNIALVILIIITVITFVPEILQFEHPNYGPVVKCIDITLIIIGNTIAVTTILICCNYQQNIVDIGNQLGEFHQKFQVKSSQKCKSELTNCEYSVIVFIFSLFSIGLVIASFFLYQSLVILSSLPCAIISASFIVKYSLIIKILKGMMKSMNEAICQMDKCLIVFPEDSFFPENIGNPRLIVRNLAAVRQARAVVCKISCQIADIHGLPSLSIIFYACCGCVSAVYFLITNFMIQQRLFLNVASMTGILWILLIMYPIVLLSETVKRFNAEMERTAGLIYDFRGTRGLNKDIIYELNDFAVELLHRKVVFSAYGFFPLDCTLLYSIFGMVVTYLIILLQYKPLDVSTH